MKLTTSGLCVAAAFAFAASLGAQTTTTTQSSHDEIEVTGCLARGADGSFMLNNAHMGAENSGTTTTTTTGTTGTTGSTSATSGTTAGNMATAGSSWKLAGDSRDLEKHLGHMVQVTGREESGHAGMSGSSTTTTTSGSTTTSSASGTTSGAGSSGTAARSLDVKSVKMISASCS